MDDNTNVKQFGMILASIFATVAIAVVTGILNGKLYRYFLFYLHLLPNVMFKAATIKSGQTLYYTYSIIYKI